MTTPNHYLIQPVTKLHEISDKVTVGETMKLWINKMGYDKELLARNLGSVVTQYGDKKRDSIQNIVDASAKHKANELGTFVIYTVNNQFRGIATIDPLSSLRRFKYGIAPPVAKRLFAASVYATGPRVTAWCLPNPNDNNGLAQTAAYNELARPDGLAADFFQQFEDNRPDTAAHIPVAAYAIEPMDAPADAHTAIRQAGYHEVDRAYFDSQASRLAFPVMSKSYIAA